VFKITAVTMQRTTKYKSIKIKTVTIAFFIVNPGRNLAMKLILGRQVMSAAIAAPKNIPL